MELSKSISKSIRKDLRKRHDEIIGRLIDEFVGLKKIGNIRNNGKRTQISSIKNSAGTIVYDKQDIADVFADFYDALYSSKSEKMEEEAALQCIAGDGAAVSRITVAEIRQQLKP